MNVRQVTWLHSPLPNKPNINRSIVHLIQVTIYTVDDRMTRSAADCRWHSSLFTYSKEGGGRAAISIFQ